MRNYDINLDYLGIIAGTSNKTALSYLEAASSASKGDSKSISNLKNFLTSIENLSTKSGTKDARISNSKGNLRNYVAFENIETAISFLKKNVGGSPVVRSIVSIRDSLLKNQAQYEDGYRSNCKLVTLEYECSVYMLTTGIVDTMCSNIQFVQSGSKVVVQKKNSGSHKTIDSIINKLASELSSSSHKKYLEDIIKAGDSSIDTSAVKSTKKTKKDLEKPLKEYGITIDDNGTDGYSFNVYKEKYSDDQLNAIFDIVESFSTDNDCDFSYYESTSVGHYDINGNAIFKESVECITEGVTDILKLIDTGIDAAKKGSSLVSNLFRSIKSSLFGIIPLIRSILFLRYKKKADKINALETQVQFIKMNIEQLQNRQNDMDPKKKEEIIKRQQAIIDAYNKKAEKLRAELTEEEKDASVSIKEEDPSMSKDSGDDDFVLEGKTISEIFGDSAFSLQ